MKNRVIQIIVTITVLAAVLCCASATPLFAAAAADELPTLSGVSLSPEGVLSWDPFPGAAAYEYGVATGGGYVTDENGNPATSVDLKKESDMFHHSSGTLNWYVLACDENRNPLTQRSTGTYDYVNTQIPLATPANPRWDGAKAVWDPVEYADNYGVELLKRDEESAENSLIVSNAVYEGTSFDFSEYLEVGNNYIFNVIAYADYSDLEHTDSAEISSAYKSFTAVQPSLTGVSIDGSLLSFDPVPGCDRIYVYAEGSTHRFSSQPVDLNDFLPPEHAEGSTPVRVWVANASGEPLVPRYALEWTYGAATLPETLPQTEPVTEPDTEPVTEPETEPVTEPVTEPETEPGTEPVTEQTTESGTTAETAGSEESTAAEPTSDSPATGNTEETVPQTDVNTAMIGEPDGLSGGAVAAIVAGCVIAAGAGGYAIYRFVIKKKGE